MKREAVTAFVVDALLPTERAALGALDAFGPLDPDALAVALPGLSRTLARTHLARLGALDLVVLVWQPGRHRPWFALAPALMGAGRAAPVLDALALETARDGSFCYLTTTLKDAHPWPHTEKARTSPASPGCHPLPT